jgi:hypothetical protein
MNRIKEINSFFVYQGYPSKSINLPFLDNIYSQCNSSHIEIIEKLWFDHWLYCNLDHYSGILLEKFFIFIK